MFKKILSIFFIFLFLSSISIAKDKIDEMIDKIKLMSLYQADAEILRPLIGVERIYIETAFKTAEEKYGSLENFIREGLNISDEEIQILRNKFVES